MEKKRFLTEKQRKKEQQDMAIYKEYHSLLAEGGSKIEIKKYVAKKYNMYFSTMYAVLHRVEKRLAQ